MVKAHLRSTVAVASLALVCSACGNSVKKTRACDNDEGSFPKAWFVGDDATEQPVFSLTITVDEAAFDGVDVDSFAGKVMSATTTAEITDSFLSFRDDATGQVVSAFIIGGHIGECAGPYDPNGFDDPPAPLQKPRQSWQDQPWFRVDWTKDLGGPEAYAFDEAGAAGYPEAAVYVPVPVNPPDLKYDLEQGDLSFRTQAFVDWQDIDEETKGCAFDLQNLAPEEPCPPGVMDLRYELHR